MEFFFIEKLILLLFSSAKQYNIVEKSHDTAQSALHKMLKFNGQTATDVMQNQFNDIWNYFVIIAGYFWQQGIHFASWQQSDTDIIKTFYKALYDEFEEYCAMPEAKAYKEMAFKSLEVCARLCIPEAQIHLRTFIDSQQEYYEYMYSFVLIKGYESECQLRAESGHPCDAAIKQAVYHAFDHAQLPANHSSLFEQWEQRLNESEIPGEPEANSKLAQLVGHNIGRYREAQALMITGLARKTGISAAYLIKIEHGTPNVRLNTLDAVADALNISAEILFT